jgi:AP2 domain
VHGEWPSGDLDHIDNISGHDWIDNLRPATREQNLANMRLHAKNTSGFKGVSWHKWRGKWRASISKKNKHSHIGFFDTPEAAHAAYVEAAQRLHGEFARAA